MRAPVIRTPEQIENLRRGFMLGPIGPYAIIMSANEINFLADKLQAKLDEIKYTWEVRVRTKDNIGMSWENIEKEPTKPNCSLDDISDMSNKLLNKYSKIEEIKITNTEDEEDSHIFKRK